MSNSASPSGTGSPGGDPAAAARQQLLAGVAQAVRTLAERLAPRTDAAQDVLDFVVRAEEMAQEAWRLGAARVPDPAQAEALAASFRAFIDEAADLARKAAREASANRELSGRMAEQAGILSGLAASSEAQDLAALRGALRPVMGALEELPARMAANNGMAEDVSGFGTRAAELGAQALAAQEHRISVTEKALAICRSLRTLAEEANVIAETLRGDSDRLRRAIGGVSSQMGTAAAATATAEARLTQVVAQGMARAPAPQGQRIDWGIGQPRR